MDAELRRLERLAALGDVEAEARVWASRLRSGTVGRERVRFGAYLGDPACQRVVGELERPTPAGDDVVAWVEGLTVWGGPDAVARARLGVAWELARRWVEAGGDWDVVALLEALDGWRVCPCHEHARELRRRIDRKRRPKGGGLLRTSRIGVSCSARSAGAMRSGIGSTVRALGGDATRGLARYVDQRLVAFVTDCLHVMTAEALWAAVGDELLPWVLEGCDPARERCEARAARDR